MKVSHLLPFAIIPSSCSPAPAENPAASLEGAASTAATTICELVWMTRNLDVVTYRTGDPIPEVAYGRLKDVHLFRLNFTRGSIRVWNTRNTAM